MMDGLGLLREYGNPLWHHRRRIKSTLDYFGELPRDRDQYYAQAFMSGVVPLYGAWYNARDSQAQMDSYMALRGIDWSNVKYPSKTVGFSGVSSFGSGTANFVSSNVTRLYR